MTDRQIQVALFLHAAVLAALDGERRVARMLVKEAFRAAFDTGTDTDHDPVDPREIDRHPTPEEIGLLPDRFRQYIHDLEARCDPAGDLRRLDAELRKRRELEAYVAEIEEREGNNS